MRYCLLTLVLLCGCSGTPWIKDENDMTVVKVWSYHDDGYAYTIHTNTKDNDHYGWFRTYSNDFHPVGTKVTIVFGE